MVSSFTFRSLIHIEFIFAHGVRKWSNIILLHVAVQFSQARFIEEAVFAALYILASFVENKVHIGAYMYAYMGFLFYLWAFYLVPLVYISVFVPVPYFLDDSSFVV